MSSHVTHLLRTATPPILSLLFVFLGAHTAAADSAPPAVPPPVTMTADQDHDRMMALLNITSIRRGADGDATSPYAANTNEAVAGPDSPLPDPLVLNDGKPVTSARIWWKERRPQIVNDFDEDFYGKVPAVTPTVHWQVTKVTRGYNGAVPIVTKLLVGHVDNSSYPAIKVDIQLSLTTPANAPGPVPVIMQFSPFAPGFPNAGFGFGFGPPGPRPGGPGAPGAGPGRPGGPPGAGPGRPGGALGSGPGRPGFGPPPGGFRPGGFGGFGAQQGPTWQQQLLAKGWGYAVLATGSIQADNGAGLTQGIIGLCNKGQPRKPDDWGVLRAWAWGASRALDYFTTDKDVDATQVGLEGHSRWGKATLVTMAYEPRFAIAYVSSSGEAGAKLWRRNFGEQVGNIAGSGEYHWMDGNFLKFDGPLTVDDMPVDAHELIAMCAPRPVFISGGATMGDGWVDAKGMFLAAAAAGPVYKLLGKKDMGTTTFPPMLTPLIDGDIAFRQHNQGHTDVPNWPTFITFASRYLHAPGPPPFDPTQDPLTRQE